MAGVTVAPAMYMDLFFEPKLDIERLRGALDTSGSWTRRNAAHGLSKRQMAELYESLDGEGGLTLDYFSPSSEPLVESIHWGHNSLPAFSTFQKRFCRPDGDDPGEELWGYNHNDPMPGALIGPGYFTATINEKGEGVIDYGKVPPRKPAAWPEIIPNSARLGRFVWVGMVDVVRRVNDQVSVGRAVSRGKAMDAWFVLCREDPAA